MNSRKLVDKLIGIIALGMALGGSCILLSVLLQLEMNVGSVLRTLVLACILLPLVFATAYLAYYLLTHSAESRLTSEQVAERARKQGEAISPACFNALNVGDTPHSRLIILSGIDGCGKSSHLHWISEALRAQGRDICYLRLRFAAIFSLPLLVIARVLGYAPRQYNPRSETVEIKHNYHSFPLMRRVWPFLFSLDMAIMVWFKVLHPLRKGKWVICDRVVLDAIADMAVLLDDERLPDSHFATRLFALMPIHAVNLILDVEPDTAFARKLDVLDVQTLVKQQAAFLKLADRFGMPVVDGNRSFAAIQADIAEQLALSPLPEHVGVLPPNIP